MAANTQDVEQIVRAVLASMSAQADQAVSAGRIAPGVFVELDDAVAEAAKAQKALRTVSMRSRVVQAIRAIAVEHARDLAELAVAETGMGRVEDKITKNISQAQLTPGPECLSPMALTGDQGLTLIENAAWGVIASVTPSTNPVATIINNSISMISAGNSVVFAPHPAAKPHPDTW